MLKNEYLIAKIGVDTAENEPIEKSDLQTTLSHSRRSRGANLGVGQDLKLRGLVIEYFRLYDVYGGVTPLAEQPLTELRCPQVTSCSAPFVTKITPDSN